jgi:enoyl-CoA hydratase/carnithine racemase
MAASTLKLIAHSAHILEVALHRPKVLNAMSSAMFAELRSTFEGLPRTHPGLRCVLLTGGEESRAFTSGLDLQDHAALLLAPGAAPDAAAAPGPDAARRAARLRALVLHYQAAVSAVARARAPVIAAIHGACIGGGVDLVCAADVRLACEGAVLRVAEPRLGLCPDLGTLQRLPALVGSASWAREVCFTARDIPAGEALARGLLSGGALYADAASLREGALAMARGIAALSPIATLGTKANLNFSAQHGVAAGLAYQAAHSASSLLTEDIALSVAGSSPSFKDVP